MFFLATRVQPKSSLVTEVLRQAAQRLGFRFRQGIVGYQGQNDPSRMFEDVRKIYKTIQAMNFTYVNTAVSFETGYQRIKTPVEALETKNGNCIEGALVFASCIAVLVMIRSSLLFPITHSSSRRSQGRVLIQPGRIAQIRF